MKDKQKVFSFNGYFALPDGFESDDINEILEEIIKYRKSKNYSKIILDQPMKDTGIQDSLWKGFNFILENTDKKLSWAAFIHQYNLETNKMEIIDK